jgi:hypothetical protein
MTAAVVLTGNHFLLDAAGGVAVALSALALSYIRLPMALLTRRGPDGRAGSDPWRSSLDPPMEPMRHVDGAEGNGLSWPVDAEEEAPLVAGRR